VRKRKRKRKRGEKRERYKNGTDGDPPSPGAKVDLSRTLR